MKGASFKDHSSILFIRNKMFLPWRGPSTGPLSALLSSPRHWPFFSHCFGTILSFDNSISGWMWKDALNNQERLNCFIITIHFIYIFSRAIYQLVNDPTLHLKHRFLHVVCCQRNVIMMIIQHTHRSGRQLWLPLTHSWSIPQYAWYNKTRVIRFNCC